MIHVITGGSGSGKSRYAEQQILELGDNRRVYLATMCPYDEESYQRIERHRAMRAEKNFETLECYTDLARLEIPEGCNVLLECMSNLVANEMFQPDAAGIHTVNAVLDVYKRQAYHRRQSAISQDEFPFWAFAWVIRLSATLLELALFGEAGPCTVK